MLDQFVQDFLEALDKHIAATPPLDLVVISGRYRFIATVQRMYERRQQNALLFAQADRMVSRESKIKHYKGLTKQQPSYKGQTRAS